MKDNNLRGQLLLKGTPPLVVAENALTCRTIVIAIHRKQRVNSIKDLIQAAILSPWS